MALDEYLFVDWPENANWWRCRVTVFPPDDGDCSTQGEGVQLSGGWVRDELMFIAIRYGYSVLRVGWPSGASGKPDR